MAGPGAPVPAAPDIIECPCPTLLDLDNRAKLTEKPDGGPVGAWPWTCTNREGHSNNASIKNNPTNNLLVNLPPLYCRGCQRVNPRGYRWDAMTCTVRGVSLDCLIHDQGDYETCVAHAILAAMNFARKLRAAIEGGYFVGQPLSIRSVFEKFHELFRAVFGHEVGPAEALACVRERCIIHILQKHGVRYSAPCCSIRNRGAPPSRGALKMGPVFLVSAKEIELIIRLLAGGYPLFCGTNIGRTFNLCSGDEIYDAGEATGDDNHSVLLIGSGIIEYPGNPTDHNQNALSTWPPMNPSTEIKGPRIFLRARNSWHVTAHGQSSLDGLGGNFNFWADQIEETEVWGISDVFDVESA